MRYLLAFGTLVLCCGCESLADQMPAIIQGMQDRGVGLTKGQIDGLLDTAEQVKAGKIDWVSTGIATATAIAGSFFGIPKLINFQRGSILKRKGLPPKNET